MTETLLILAAAYLLGTVPWSHLIARAAGHNLHGLGDGNIGAHNVMRHVGRWWGGLALVLDAGKGAAAVLAAKAWSNEGWLSVGAALAAVLGHNYPLWLRFHGGKGLATSFGAALALVPALAWLISLMSVVLLALTKNFAFSGLMVGVGLSLAAYVLDYPVAQVLAPLGLVAAMASRQIPDLRRMWREAPSKRELIWNRWIRDRNAKL